MKVLLVYMNRYRPMAPPPIGIAYLVEPLRREGHDVKVVDLMFSRDPEGELRRAIAGFRPDVAGLSLRNVDNQDMRHTQYFVDDAKRLAGIVKSAGVTTVLGGTAFTTFPAQMLEYLGADYGIAGQGEESLPRLLASLNTGSLDRGIPGLVWRENGHIKANPPDLGGYRSKARWDLVPMNGYAKGFLAGAVVTKSGCPYRCAYCNVTTAFGGELRPRNVDDIVGEIRALKAQGTRVITLTDACFNTPAGYAKDVLSAIIRSGLKVYLNTTIVPVAGHFDDELLGLFKKAGGICASLGAETFSRRMLRSYNKPFTLEDALACARLLDRHKIPFMVQALFGGPGENASTIRESLDTLRHVHYASFTYTMGIRLLPGTRLFETAKGEGLVNDASELFKPRFYISRDLDVQWAERMIKRTMLRYSYRNLKMLPVRARRALAGIIR
ncbi:MAG TPA: radical SAM protein [Methanocella sp.]|uniref:B12-binding domain-containing radical SAM protein n=1 Tax=Methanocella sp. TaxID=2052833 RepID=UPI002C4F2065|nr:radical SAM protein [Methanocella sp.]HTY90500.1 radical SAM protein [Methanocella sp.]